MKPGREMDKAVARLVGAFTGETYEHAISVIGLMAARNIAEDQPIETTANADESIPAHVDTAKLRLLR